MSTPSDYLASLYSLSGKVAVVIGGTGELCGAMAEGMAGAAGLAEGIPSIERIELIQAPQVDGIDGGLGSAVMCKFIGVGRREPWGAWTR